MKQRATEENKKIVGWAYMNETKFFLEYFKHSTGEEIRQFQEEFPQFLNKKIVNNS